MCGERKLKKEERNLQILKSRSSIFMSSLKFRCSLTWQNLGVRMHVLSFAPVNPLKENSSLTHTKVN